MLAPLPETPTALDVIKRSILLHPSLFLDALKASQSADNSYALTVHETDKRTWNAVKARASATGRAIEAVDCEEPESLSDDMAAGIIALNIACKLQCLPPHIRTDAAVRTWEN